jgi:hypothetical protein
MVAANGFEFSDAPALHQLADGLWRGSGKRGAAVMVGAGLSRAAGLLSADTPRPPLWSDLANAMKIQLYAGREEAAPWDPLRLAEEYRTYFGQSALDAFIRQRVPDGAWNPSDLHRRLVELPWSDVLTTNYDTLLERAADLSDRTYDPVRTDAEVAVARAPRIVKLHGSIGATDHFVIAEEDYRTYPVRHAAFVNLACQSFVENELLLLGFSGDDPNFLAWSGWVRDQLGSSARRIFLAGALGLSHSKRKLLEARNIAPIDVYDLVKNVEPGERHDAATRILLDALEGARPVPAHAWSPAMSRVDVTTGPEDRVPALGDLLTAWRRERDAYPGWLICPRGRRSRLQISSRSSGLSSSALQKCDPSVAARLMVELCWREGLALTSLGEHGAALVLQFADPQASAFLDRDERLLVAEALLRHARQTGDEALLSRVRAVIEAHASAGSDALASLRHQEALQALTDLNFERVVELVPSVSGLDPAWRFRAANLLASCGQLTKAAAMMEDLVQELRARERRNRGSIWIRSRLAWAEFALRAHRRHQLRDYSWPSRYREDHCDPWQEVESIRDALTEARRKREAQAEGAVPRFEPGSFRLPSQTIIFGDREEPFEELINLLDQTCLPSRLGRVAMFKQEMLEALGCSFQGTLADYLNLVRSGCTARDPIFEVAFSRLAMARMNSKAAVGLVERLMRARAVWSGLIHDSDEELARTAVDRLAEALSMLARLAVRMPADDAAELHGSVLSFWGIASNQRWPLQEPVAELLQRTFEVAPDEDKPRLAMDGLKLPLAQDRSAPEPVRWLSSRSLKLQSGHPELAATVDFLLEAARGSSRAAAVSRLVVIDGAGGLKADERERFSEVAWSMIDQSDPPLPGGTMIYPHYWATLPKGDEGTVAEAIFGRLYRLEDSDMHGEHFAAMVHAGRSGNVTPPAEIAALAFDRLVAFRPEQPDASDFGAVVAARLRGYEHMREAHLAGAALSIGVARFLSEDALTQERVGSIEDFVRETGSLSAATALVPFLGKIARAEQALVLLVRRGLLSHDEEQVGYATDALHVWHEESIKGKAPALDLQLVEQLVSVIELRRERALWRVLSVATELVRAGAVPQEALLRLEGGLSDLLEEADYYRVQPMTDTAGTISLLRRECVKLAKALIDSGLSGGALRHWMAAGNEDPLPEVRGWALRDFDEE